MSKPVPRTVVSHETIFHGCTPLLTVEVVLTLYPAGVSVAPAHKHIARAKPYEWLMIGELDPAPFEPRDPRLAAMGETTFAAHYVGMGDDGEAMMNAMRDHFFQVLFLLFPLDDEGHLLIDETDEDEL